MEFDLRQLVQIARRRWWIVLLLMLVAGAIGFVVSSRQQDMYAASARVVVLAGQGQAGTEYNSLLASRSLAETYRLLVETGPVLDRVIERLELPYGFEELDQKVDTSVVGETQVIEVSVEDPDPVVAAQIATTIVEEFQAYIDDTVDPRLLAQVDVADPARVPDEPFEPRLRLMLGLGLVVGLFLGAGLVALLEFWDNTVRPEQNILGLTGAPLLATVSAINKLPPGGGQVYSMSQPRSSAAEALRLLRTNLEFAAASGEIGSLTITSPGPGEGKSTTVANLGVVLAQSGKRVVIIDADLRKPTLHTIFGVPNEQGLTTLLTHPEEAWTEIARRIAVPGLLLIPSGPLPPNPADLLASSRFEALLDSIRAENDIVLIDSPPVLAASDSLSVADHTDGVMLVCRSHGTRVEHVRQAAHLIHQGGIRLVGIVLNRQKGQRGASYYGEYYGRAHVAGD